MSGRKEEKIPRSVSSSASFAPLVRNVEQIIALGELTDGAALAFSLPALGALHQAPAPGVRGGVTN